MTNSLTREPDQPQKAWLFKEGEWTLFKDPVLNRPEDDLSDATAAAGYTSWTRVGKDSTTPLALQVYSRPAKPSFLFELEGVHHSESVYAETLPDALVLLNQLAPTLQALTVTDQIAEADPKSLSVLGDVLDKLHGRRRDQGGHIIRD